MGRKKRNQIGWRARYYILPGVSTPQHAFLFTDIRPPPFFPSSAAVTPVWSRFAAFCPSTWYDVQRFLSAIKLRRAISDAKISQFPFAKPVRTNSFAKRVTVTASKHADDQLHLYNGRIKVETLGSLEY